MKNIKQLFCGIIIGAVAAVSITAFAEYVIVPNSFPVKVNGQTVQVEGYNINDSTYFKLRDVADAVGGFDVDFIDGTITIQSDSAPTPTPDTSVVSNTSLAPNPKLSLPADFTIGSRYGDGIVAAFTSDGLPVLTLSNANGQYVDISDIQAVYDFKKYGYKFGTNSLYDSEYKTIIDNIVLAPDTIDNNIIYMELQYYQSVFYPWLQNNCH